MAFFAGCAAQILCGRNRVITVTLFAGRPALVHAAFNRFLCLTVTGGTFACSGGVGMGNLLDVMTVDTLQGVVDGLLEGCKIEEKRDVLAPRPRFSKTLFFMTGHAVLIGNGDR